MPWNGNAALALQIQEEMRSLFRSTSWGPAMMKEDEDFTFTSGNLFTKFFFYNRPFYFGKMRSEPMLVCVNERRSVNTENSLCGANTSKNIKKH